MEGEITIGLYAINPSSQRCKWVAIDADYKNAMEDLVKLQYHLTQDGVDSALEMSRRGGHLWIFLATPLLARKCRIYIYNLARRLGVPVKGSGLADGIEVFPKHDVDCKGGIRQRDPRPVGNPPRREPPLLVLWRRLHVGSADEILEAATKGHGRGVGPVHHRQGSPGRFAESHSEVKPIGELPTGGSRKAFCILDHVGKTRIVGKNHVARCPSCAQVGHDRSGDNLAILVSDPTVLSVLGWLHKEMIRAALGHPIRVQQTGMTKERR